MEGQYIPQFEPLNLANIEQGRFIRGINEKLIEAQDKLLVHVGEHEGSAKSGLKVNVELHYDQKRGVFFIDTDIEVKPPKQPSRSGHSTAHRHTGLDGKGDCLKTQAGGSSVGNPQQAHLRDGDGHPIAE